MTVKNANIAQIVQNVIKELLVIS